MSILFAIESVSLVLPFFSVYLHLCQSAATSFLKRRAVNHRAARTLQLGQAPPQQLLCPVFCFLFVFSISTAFQSQLAISTTLARLTFDLAATPAAPTVHCPLSIVLVRECRLCPVPPVSTPRFHPRSVLCADPKTADGRSSQFGGPLCICQN